MTFDHHHSAPRAACLHRAFLCALLLASWGAATAACAQQEAMGRGSAPESRSWAPHDEYHVGPADVLHISVWKNENLSRTLTVRPDGMISLPLVNEVQAAGLTPMQLRDILVARLSEFADVAAPEVTVIVEEVRSFTISVLGEVSKPGRFTLQSRATVLDLLAMAGGFTEFAAPSRIVVLRTRGSAVERIPFDYDRIISSGTLPEKFLVEPEDVILVP